MIRPTTLLLIITLISCSYNNTDQAGHSDISAEKIFNNFIALHPDTVAYKTEAKSYKWNYEQGFVLEGFYRMWKETGEQKYYSYLKKNIDYYVDPDGDIKTYDLNDYNLDNISPGRLLLHLYAETKNEKYHKAANLLMKQIEGQPKTSEGGFWHKKRYPYQMWLDGLFMAEPFNAEYALMFNKTNEFNEIINQFLLIEKHLKDKNTGLYYHGWDESRKQKWADPVTGTSPNFWGRANGWFLMALVDVLDSFPQNHKDRKTIEEMFTNLSTSLLNYRNSKSKLWFQILNQGKRKGNYIETSASLMFIYGFAKGVRKGYLPEKFLDVAEESYNSILENYITKDETGNLFLQNTVSVGGLGGDPYRDGSFKYYISEPIRVNDFKGYGALMFSAIELMKIKNN